MTGRSLACAFLAIVAGCGPNDSKAAAPGAGGPAVPVRVATAARADVPIEIRAIGTVEPVASVVIRPRLAGAVVDLRFEEGADVHADDPLVLLDPRPFEAVLHAAEAELRRDSALAEDAKQAAGQIEGAFGKSAVSQRSAEQARATAAAAEALVLKDQAAVETARLELEYCTIRAPFDGRTGKLSVRKGSVVKENETELVTVTQIVPIRVAFTLPEARLAEVRKASAAGPLPVRVEVPGSGAPVEGVLTFIDNSVVAASGTIALLATFANHDRGLWPGQFVQVSISTGTDRGAVVVPTVAIQSGQKGDFVFVVKQDGTVDMRPVAVKRTAGDASVLGEGVEAGEVVVTDGHLRLVPGSRVEAGKTADDASR